MVGVFRVFYGTQILDMVDFITVCLVFLIGNICTRYRFQKVQKS